MKNLFFVLLAVLVMGCAHSSVYTHVYNGKKVRNYNSDSRNRGRIGTIYRVYKDHWGNCSWALVHYEGSAEGGYAGEMLVYLWEVEK